MATTPKKKSRNRATKEFLLELEDDPTTVLLSSGRKYSKAYLDTCFNIWYSNGRIGRAKLINLLPEDENGDRLSEDGIAYYIAGTWTKLADELDKMVASEIRKQLVSERVEMVKRHAEIGKKLIEVGLNYFKYVADLEEEMTPQVAVMAIKEGVRIEAGSVGMDSLMKAIHEMNDDKIVGELQDFLKGDKISNEELHELLSKNIEDIDESSDDFMDDLYDDFEDDE